MASPTHEMEDVVMNCKACNMLLEEGKAYELAGYRWHIDCFQCCKCQQSLNSEANLLLLGDGSLICNGCTYTCEVCKNKIEDLAILTSDLAFCESCFRCRNCEKQIENLKYARTSHGIFCMECHEAQAASRRRRKARQAHQNRLHAKNVADKYKSLPALPLEAAKGHQDPYVDVVDPNTRLGRETEELSQAMQTLTLPATTYNNSDQRHSVLDQNGMNTADEGMFIPVTLDPTPVAATFPPEALQLPHLYPEAPSGSHFSSGSESQSPTLPPRRSPAREIESPMPPYALVQPPQTDPHFQGHLPTPSNPRLSDLNYNRNSSFKPHDSLHATKPKPGTNPASPVLSDTGAPSIRAISADLTTSPEAIRNGSSMKGPSPGDNVMLASNRENLPARGDSLSAPRISIGSQSPVNDLKQDALAHPERSSSRSNSNTQAPTPGFSPPKLDDDPHGYYAFSSLQPEWYPGQEPSTSRSSPRSDQSMASQLDVARKRIAELEADNRRLTTIIDKTAKIKNADSILEEKRLTMATLDSRREVMVRELNAMNEYEKLRGRNQGASPEEFGTRDIVSGFTSELSLLKSQFQAEIETMVKQRTALENEITNLIQMKDKGFQEYEALSSRNAQLTNLNNQLLASVQGQYRPGRAPDSHQPGALGIDSSTNHSNWPAFSENAYGSAMSGHDALDADVSIVESPQLIEIRKAKPKTKVWGRQIARGLKGALGIEKQPSGDRYGVPITEAGLPYSQISAGESPNIGTVPRGQQERTGGFGSLFASSNKGGRRGAHGVYNPRANSSTSNLAATAPPNELQIHYELEGNHAPRLVTACIEEVDARGLDQQGIYRLSGSKNEVDELRDCFESKGPVVMTGIDIHVVTSTLKQYFRKLDTPLITFDVYDYLIGAAHSPDMQACAVEMRAALDRLPEAHFVCVKLLLAHLVRVVGRCKENLMNVHNLSIVFAPTIMRTEDLDRERKDLEIRAIAMQRLVELYEPIFADAVVSSAMSTASTAVASGNGGGGGGPAASISDSASGTTAVSNNTVTGIPGLYNSESGANLVGSREVPAM